MLSVIKINHPNQLDAALLSNCKIIRIGEEYCFDRAQQIWPVNVIAQILERIIDHDRKAELSWLNSPTTADEEK